MVPSSDATTSVAHCDSGDSHQALPTSSELGQIDNINMEGTVQATVVNMAITKLDNTNELYTHDNTTLRRGDSFLLSEAAGMFNTPHPGRPQERTNQLKAFSSTRNLAPSFR